MTTAARKAAHHHKSAAQKTSGRFVPPALETKSSAISGNTLSLKRVGTRGNRIPEPQATALGFSAEPLLEAVLRRVPLAPGVARALKNDFKQLLATHLMRPALAPAPEDPVLTTQQAADLAGVSRPFLVARIDAGDLPLHHRVGNQRRVLQSAVVAWQNRERQRQRRALTRLGADLDDEIFSD